MSSILLQCLEKTKVGPNWRAKRGDLFEIVNIHSAKYQKKVKGTLREKFSKQASQCRKLKEGPFGLARYCMSRGKKGKTFLVTFLMPNGSI